MHDSNLPSFIVLGLYYQEPIPGTIFFYRLMREVKITATPYNQGSCASTGYKKI